MGDFFATIKRQISEFFAKIDKKQRITLIVILVLIFAVSLTAGIIMNRVNYTALYSGLDASEAGEVKEVLDGMGVNSKSQGSGTILVPEKEADELRMTLAAQGYPKTGLNYDIYGGASGFGSTAEDRKVYLQAQLQDNIRRTLTRIDKVKDCTVLVTLSTESSYVLSSDETEAQASIMLRLNGSDPLTREEVTVIRNLVKTSVSGLKPENITITDSDMNLYTMDDEQSPGFANTQYELKYSVENKLAQQVTNLLSPVFGSNNIKTAVSATLNFDSKKVSSVEFAPPVEGEDKGMMVSIDELYEATKDRTSDGGVAGTDSNGLDAVEYVYDGLDENEYYEKVQKTINYELNETRTEVEKAKGQIEDLSVAVLIDTKVLGEDSEPKVRNLVASAIGVDAKYISVENMPFLQTEEPTVPKTNWLSSLAGNSDVLKTLIVALMFIVIAVLILMFLRTIFGRHTDAPRLAGAYDGQQDGGIDFTVGDDEEVTLERKLKEINKEKSMTSEQIEKFIEKDSEAVAQLLRNWLTDDFK